MTTDVKAEAYVKNVWRVPLTDRDGVKSTYDVRAGWDPEKMSAADIANVAAIEATRARGIGHAADGTPELVTG